MLFFFLLNPTTFPALLKFLIWFSPTECYPSQGLMLNALLLFHMFYARNPPSFHIVSTTISSLVLANCSSVTLCEASLVSSRTTASLSLQSHLKCIPFTLFSLLGSLSFEDFALQWAFRPQCWRQPRLLPLSHLSIILPINYHALQNTLCIVLFKFIHLSLMFLLFHLLKLPSPPPPQILICRYGGEPQICIFLNSSVVGGT